MKFFLLPVLAALLSSPAHSTEDGAACPQQMLAVGKYLKVKNFAGGEGGMVVAETCKAWSHQGGLSLAAFAFDNGIEDEKSLVVAVLDKENARVLRAYTSVISEDSLTKVGAGSFKFDTGKYQLSKDVRGFGLRFNSTGRNPSCADSLGWDELSLFVQDKDKLRQVLTIDMQTQTALQGCLGAATGQDIWESGSRTISLGTAVHNGFADLIVTETITVDSNAEVIPADISTRKRTRRFPATYNGQTYEYKSE